MFLHRHGQLQLLTVTTVDKDLENLQSQRFIFCLNLLGSKNAKFRMQQKEIMKQFQCG